MSNFYIEYETTTGTQYQEFDTGVNLTSFILFNKESFINHCKVVAKLPEITNCFGLFLNCPATSLDLSSFDTSNVTDMSGMFINCSATSLDLSSFDTSNVTNMSGMFINCSATTGYARTQADADRFNSSSNKPAGLVFTVKEQPEPTGIGKILFNTNEFKKIMFENKEYVKIMFNNEIIWSKGEIPVGLTFVVK